MEGVLWPDDFAKSLEALKSGKAPGLRSRPRCHPKEEEQKDVKCEIMSNLQHHGLIVHSTNFISGALN